MIDGHTGVVMFEVNGKNSEPWVVEYTTPDWDDVVSKAVDSYPEFFQPRIVKAPVTQYMDQSEERAKRERAAQVRPVSYLPVPQLNNADFSLMKQGQDNYVKDQQEKD
jgi:hypothetical protein